MKIEFVHLRRQVFGEFRGKCGEGVGLLGQVLLALLEFGDVGIDRNGAAVLGAPLADHDPSAIVATLHLRLARVAMLAQPLRYPLFNAANRVRDVAPLGGVPDNALECLSRAQFDFHARVEQVTVARVADDQPILAIVADETFRDTFNRFGEPPLAAQTRLFRASQRRDVVKPEQPLAPGHSDVATGIGDLDIGNQQAEKLAASWSSKPPLR